MDPRNNPYAPGAGSPPPELAGRDPILERIAISLDRIKERRHAKSIQLIGLRGVGKTVLLNRIAQDAEARGIVCPVFEAPEDRSLPSLLAPTLRGALLRLDRLEAAKGYVQRAWRVLSGFITAAKVKYDDIEFHLKIDPEPGFADTGDLEIDLSDLFSVVGEAAAERNRAIAIFIDELQYVKEDELAALITALHRCQQRRLPVTIVGAGLPQLVGNTGKAKSYAERLFDFPVIGRLDRPAAIRALQAPAEHEGASFEPAALDKILALTQGYPYFLQEWGSHAWLVAECAPITSADIDTATELALAALDTSFFRVRYDRCTRTERQYLRAMAELGAGPHKSGDIANIMGRKVTSVAPLRSTLISKGMIFSPEHGDTAFTVPLFDEFMKRTMPDFV